MFSPSHHAVYHVIFNLELEGMWWRWQCCGAEKLRFLINIPLLSPQQLWSVICNLPAPPALWSRHHAVWRVTCDQSVTSVTVTVVSHCAVQKSRLSKQCAWQVAWPGMCYTLHCVALHSVLQCVTVCYTASVPAALTHTADSGSADPRLGPSITPEEGRAAPTHLLIYRHCPGAETFLWTL